MAHALLSASGAERWYNCTPSARLEENFPQSESTYALEGTTAHTLAEAINSYNFKYINKSELKKRLAELEKNEYYNTDMQDYIAEFSRFVHEEYKEAKQKTPDAKALLEQRLDFSDYVPDGFGTGDVVIISDQYVHIIDLKYGKGIPIDAEKNMQMMLYALGAYSVYGLIYDFDKVKMTIYQPRLDNISTWEIGIPELLQWAEGELKEKAHLAYDGAGDYKPGDHCKFCRAGATCRARAEENLRLQQYEFKHPDLLTDDEVSDILIIAERLKSWADDIANHALNEALKGKKWRGFKLVEGRSNRKYIDETAVMELLDKSGYKHDEITKTSILGITDMEKLLSKKRFNELLSVHVIKPTGKPTLVSVTDNRPEFNSAAIDFADVNIDEIN